MMEEAKEMLQEAVEAFVNGDEQAAQEVIARDDVVDDLFNQVKSKMDSITKEVNEYLSFIEEDVHREEEQLRNDKVGKTNRDEAQNHIIQAVLKEYFP